MGLPGEPEDPEASVVFEVQGVVIYLAREVWEGLVDETGRLEVLMPGYGEAWVRFENPD